MCPGFDDKFVKPDQGKRKTRRPWDIQVPSQLPHPPAAGQAGPKETIKADVMSPGPGTEAGEGKDKLQDIREEIGKKKRILLESLEKEHKESPVIPSPVEERGYATDQPGTAGEITGLIQVVEFLLNDKSFGIRIEHIHEIIRAVPRIRLPNTPDYIEGMISLRSRIVPLIDLRKKLGLETGRVYDDTKIIIIEQGVKLVGLIVDSIEQVVNIESGTITRTGSLLDTFSVRQNWIEGVANLEKKIIVLLDIDGIISGQDAD